MIFLYLLVGYFALYLVIWLHEVGHALLYKRYNCKENPFIVHVPIYLFFSTPRPVDEEKEKTLRLKEKFYIGMAGITVNLCFGIPIFFILSYTKLYTNILFFFLYSFSLFHLVEAVSYLVVNNIFIASDMESVRDYKPKLRIPLSLLGLVLIYPIINMIANSPYSWSIGYIFAIAIITICMGLGRIIFSNINKSKNNQLF